MTYYILVVMQLSRRRIEIVGITLNPDTTRMQQMAKNLTHCYDVFLNNTKYLLLDRDKKFLPFCGVLESTDTEVILLPPRSPNLNVYIERYRRCMKSECMNRMIFFGENTLRRVLSGFADHYHAQRNHQGFENKIIDFKGDIGSTDGTVQRRERLGGMLSYYYHDAT